MQPHSSGVAFAISLLPFILFVCRPSASCLVVAATRAHAGRGWIMTTNRTDVQWDENTIYMWNCCWIRSSIPRAIIGIKILHKNEKRTTKISMTIQSTFATAKIVWLKCTSISWLATLCLCGLSACERYDGSRFSPFWSDSCSKTYTSARWAACGSSEQVSFASRYQIWCAILPFRACALCIHYFPPHNPFSCSAKSLDIVSSVYFSRYQPTDLNSLLFSFFFSLHWCSLSPLKSLWISSLTGRKRTYFKRVRCDDNDNVEMQSACCCLLNISADELV